MCKQLLLKLITTNFPLVKREYIELVTQVESISYFSIFMVPTAEIFNFKISKSSYIITKITL